MLFSLHCGSCILFANKRKSRVLGTLEQETVFLGAGSSTQKGTVSLSRLYFLHTSQFTSHCVLSPATCSMTLNSQPITKSKAGLERKLPFQRWDQAIDRNQPARNTALKEAQRMRYTKCWIVLVAGLLALGPSLSAKNPSEAKTEQDRLPNAGKVMHEILNVPADIPQDLIDKA